MYTLVVAGLAGLALAVAGAMYQAIGSARDARRFPPPGPLVDIDGHRLHAVHLGHGTPTVVLESAIAGSSLSWARVQPEVARFTSVYAYDRAGLAWSDASSAPRTVTRIIDELHALLRKLECAAPCVMVGHSFGVFVCLAYAARYPHQVAGLVLVDPPSEWVHMNRRQARLLLGGYAPVASWRTSRSLGCRARVSGVVDWRYAGRPASFCQDVWPHHGPHSRTACRRGAEVASRNPADGPGVVVPAEVFSGDGRLSARAARHGGVSSADRAARRCTAGRDLERRSDAGRCRIASGAGADVIRRPPRRRPHGHHWVQFDAPELVVETIREVVDAVRRRRESLDSLAERRAIE